MNSNEARILGYVGLVGLALIARMRERRRAPGADGVWPPFWWWTAAFLAAMAVGRAGEIGGLIGELGREQANDSGWYESRRPLQAAVVGGLGFVWFSVVAVALWRTPERRRRYLPVGVMVVTIAAFAAVRIVSLHQVDALLYRRHVGPVRVSTMVEWCLLACTALATCWIPLERSAGRKALDDRRVPA